MRTTFIETLCDLAERDERIWLITGDLGYSVLERFSERFPERYINVGVAEQNMTGIAAGLAHSGLVVFTYSIANFPVMRCLEQIRNDVCYHNMNVKVVAVGGGFSYGTAGYTHHGVEDLAVMRAMPNMTVVAPADPYEARRATEAVASHAGPCYLRLGKSREPEVHEGEPAFALGKAIVAREGDDAAIISTGAMLKDSLEAADRLASRSISSRVLSMHTVRPLDADSVRNALVETRAVVTVEEHRAYGGLGGAVAEVVAEAGVANNSFRMLAARDEALREVGSQEYLRELSGLSPAAIAESVAAALEGRR